MANITADTSFSIEKNTSVPTSRKLLSTPSNLSLVSDSLSFNLAIFSALIDPVNLSTLAFNASLFSAKASKVLDNLKPSSPIKANCIAVLLPCTSTPLMDLLNDSNC